MSLCKQNYSAESEAAVNRQINVELKASHAYLSMASYFGRDSVALFGLQKFFQKSSDEEREHAEKLIKYQNMRGGNVVLTGVPEPNNDWKSARNAVEVALQMEKDVNRALLEFHQVSLMMKVWNIIISTHYRLPKNKTILSWRILLRESFWRSRWRV